MIMDTLDAVTVELELGDGRGRKVNPVGAQLGKRDRPPAGSPQSFEQPLLLGVGTHHRVPPVLGHLSGVGDWG